MKKVTGVTITELNTGSLYHVTHGHEEEVWITVEEMDEDRMCFEAQEAESGERTLRTNLQNVMKNWRSWG